MELINRNIITIAITSMLMSNTVSAKDLFVELESEKKYVNSLSKEKVAEFHLWLNNYLDGYEQWRDAYINDLDIYRSALIEQWGRGDVSDKNKYVEYSDDNQVKKVIDYDNNTVTISVLTDEIINEKKNSSISTTKNRY
nr:murein transglycosylase domain-containing protein [Photobacterium kishitanii]